MADRFGNSSWLARLPASWIPGNARKAPARTQPAWARLPRAPTSSAARRHARGRPQAARPHGQRDGARRGWNADRSVRRRCRPPRRHSSACVSGLRRGSTSGAARRADRAGFGFKVAPETAALMRDIAAGGELVGSRQWGRQEPSRGLWSVGDASSRCCAIAALSRSCCRRSTRHSACRASCAPPILPAGTRPQRWITPRRKVSHCPYATATWRMLDASSGSRRRVVACKARRRPRRAMSGSTICSTPRCCAARGTLAPRCPPRRNADAGGAARPPQCGRRAAPARAARHADRCLRVADGGYRCGRRVADYPPAALLRAALLRCQRRRCCRDRSRRGQATDTADVVGPRRHCSRRARGSRRCERGKVCAITA